MTKKILFAGSLFCLLASSAFAQPGPDTTPGPVAAGAPKLPPEVEHGFYVEFDFGTLMYLGDAGANVQPGVMAGFAVGTDVGRFLKVEGRMLNATSDSTGKIFKASAPANVIAANPCPDGDASNACVQAPDVQSTLVLGSVKGVYPMSERLELHGLLGGGMLMSNPAPEQLFEFDAAAQLNDPKSVESGSTAVFGGGAGIEYFTRLRHFSVGADLAVWTGGGGMMVTLFPTIKYTF